MCSMKKEYSILKKEALTALSSYMDSLGENQVDQKDENYEMRSAKRRLQLESINIQIESMKERAARCKKMLQEVQKMKQGSIALVGQITTVSKLRIYDPLYPSDVLSNIRLSSDSLEKLDTKLKALYTYQK